MKSFSNVIQHAKGDCPETLHYIRRQHYIFILYHHTTVSHVVASQRSGSRPPSAQTSGSPRLRAPGALVLGLITSMRPNADRLRQHAATAVITLSRPWSENDIRPIKQPFSDKRGGCESETQNKTVKWHFQKTAPILSSFVSVSEDGHGNAT